MVPAFKAVDFAGGAYVRIGICVQYWRNDGSTAAAGAAGCMLSRSSSCPIPATTAAALFAGKVLIEQPRRACERLSCAGARDPAPGSTGADRAPGPHLGRVQPSMSDDVDECRFLTSGQVQACRRLAGTAVVEDLERPSWCAAAKTSHPRFTSTGSTRPGLGSLPTRQAPGA